LKVSISHKKMKGLFGVGTNARPAIIINEKREESARIGKRLLWKHSHDDFDATVCFDRM